MNQEDTFGLQNAFSDATYTGHFIFDIFLNFDPLKTLIPIKFKLLPRETHWSSPKIHALIFTDVLFLSGFDGHKIKDMRVPGKGEGN